MLQLWGASLASAGGAAIVAVGSRSRYSATSSGSPRAFQLLELANPSQPLLRRLLLETPGTYHHSLMVGNLAERAAEAIGADPLLARVAAYYHDIGKLANPAGVHREPGRDGQPPHDLLTPQESAARAEGARGATASISPTSTSLPKADHRVHPAAPRHGAHELLLREGPGAGRCRGGRSPGYARGGRLRRPSTSAASATPGPSRSRARRRSSCCPTAWRPPSGR